MASWEAAFDWIMQFEDPKRHYEEKIDNNGAKVISGINAASFPVQEQSIAAIPQAQRGPAVEDFYKTVFWNQWLAKLTSDALAGRVMDARVNQGPETAIKILQEAINSIKPGSIEVDGLLGPNTVAAANSLNQDLLLDAFQDQRLGYYQDIVENDPSQAEYLGTAQNPGPWWRRAVA